MEKKGGGLGNGDKSVIIFRVSAPGSSITGRRSSVSKPFSYLTDLDAVSLHHGIFDGQEFDAYGDPEKTKQNEKLGTGIQVRIWITKWTCGSVNGCRILRSKGAKVKEGKTAQFVLTRGLFHPTVVT